MSSFTSTTVKVLAVGAVVLGAGVYYQNFASHRLDEANQAMRRVEGAQMQAETTKRRAEMYVSLLAEMTDRNVDRQEPISVVSEFTPQEINQIGSLLDTLYQRDGHFFLQRFQLSWQTAKSSPGRPRVALELDGRKVLLFSDDAIDATSVKTAKR